jgi:hypothetical protein
MNLWLAIDLKLTLSASNEAMVFKNRNAKEINRIVKTPVRASAPCIGLNARRPTALASLRTRYPPFGLLSLV